MHNYALFEFYYVGIFIDAHTKYNHIIKMRNHDRSCDFAFFYFNPMPIPFFCGSRDRYRLQE